MQCHIVIHPPIVLENLLPCAGTFELFPAVKERGLPIWRARIEAGKLCHIHTVSLEEPIVLLIQLDFCSSNDPILVHKPRAAKANTSNIAEALKLNFNRFLDDDEEVQAVASMTLSDPDGQSLRLHVENVVGGGGQRHLVVFCPFWVVNVSQYSIRLKEEGSRTLPAGTTTYTR